MTSSALPSEHKTSGPAQVRIVLPNQADYLPRKRTLPRPDGQSHFQAAVKQDTRTYSFLECVLRFRNVFPRGRAFGEAIATFAS